jgi:DNA-binding winged helix-turn-helix (wHTH) protein/TolB-like protein/Flp pilus assembly protein TadD
MSPVRKHYYQFGLFLLDEGERTLLREGEPVPLTPKAFDTLLVLVRRCGQTLSKEELMQEIWPDSFVEEANLAVNISLLRKTLGEREDGGQYIETYPRQGYRFAAEAREIWQEPEPSDEPPSATEPAPEATGRESHIDPAQPPDDPLPDAQYAAAIKRVKLAGAALALIILAVAGLAYRAYKDGQSAPTRRLAVLPFKNERPDPESDFLSYSLADTVITKLGYVSGLVVRPSSYVEKYTNREVDPQRVAKELDVDTLLMGSYVRDGQDLRVSAQLIDVKTGNSLWSERVDVKRESLITLQEYVAWQVIKGLHLNLSSAELERVRSKVSDNPLAYEYFLRSRYLLATSEHAKAIEMLEKSVEIDANNSLAWAYLGRAYHLNALQFFGGRRDLVRAEAAYDQALLLDPREPTAHLLMAKLFTETNRVEQAAPLLRELIEKNPNNAAARWELSYAYRYGGMLKESIEEGERALEIDSNLKSHVFNSYLYAGQYDKFVASLPAREDAYEIFYRGFGQYYLKDHLRAAAAFDRAYELNPKSIISQIGRGLRLSIAGNAAESKEVLRAAEAEVEKGGVGDGEITYKIAQGYASLGERGAALRALSRSVEQGFFCHPYFASDPLLASLRDEPEFAAILEKARIRHEDYRRKLF